MPFNMIFGYIDVGDRFRMLVTDLIHWKNHQHNEKNHQHNDVTNITVTHLRVSVRIGPEFFGPIRDIQNSVDPCPVQDLFL